MYRLETTYHISETNTPHELRFFNTVNAALRAAKVMDEIPSTFTKSYRLFSPKHTILATINK